MTREQRRSFRYFKRGARRVIGAMLLVTAIILTFIYLNYTLKSQYIPAAVVPEPVVVSKVETVTPVAVEDYPNIKSLGMFTITFYCGEPDCKICGGGGETTFGTQVRDGVISVDPNVIPLGSTVFIDGEEFMAEDTGPWVKGKHIDMFITGSHEDALSRGRIEREVFVYDVDFE